jgi:hypothetical protein
MLTFKMHIKISWGDYFTGTPTLFQTNVYETRQTPTVKNVYVLNCLFGPITSSNAGGALYCDSSVTYLLIESTSFFSCKTSSYAGAIYFESTSNGQCVLYRVCGNDCSATSSNYNIQFARTQVYNVISSKNYVNYSSISRCISAQSSSWYVLVLDNGKICCPSVNLSMNKCYGQTIRCQPFSDSNYVTCSLSSSSFTDNIANGYTCICLYRTGAKYEIKSCNILRNSQGTLDTQGTIYTTGYLTIEDSCILENTATYMFRSSSSSYTITLSNCTVDSTSNNGCLTITNTVTKFFILALNHMSTQNCHSEYDSAGTLTPIIQTPSSSKKPKLCYTGKKFLHQLPLSDVISVISILIFNFIYPYASYDPLC